MRQSGSKPLPHWRVHSRPLLLFPNNHLFRIKDNVSTKPINAASNTELRPISRWVGWPRLKTRVLWVVLKQANVRSTSLAASISHPPQTTTSRRSGCLPCSEVRS